MFFQVIYFFAYLFCIFVHWNLLFSLFSLYICYIYIQVRMGNSKIREIQNNFLSTKTCLDRSRGKQQLLRCWVIAGEKGCFYLRPFYKIDSQFFDSSSRIVEVKRFFFFKSKWWYLYSYVDILSIEFRGRY